MNVWYHVGSKNEHPGRTGFAHLFEHLMFEGSQHYDKGYFHPLQAAGAEVDVISLRHGSIRGVNLHEPASRVHVDKTIAEANPDDCIGVLIPGGAKSPAILAENPDVLRFLRAIDGGGKLVASICRGSLLTARSGIAKGRRITGFHLTDQFPDLVIRPTVEACGGIWVEDQAAVVDGNLISSRHPDDMPEFAAAIRKWIDGVGR